MSDIWRWALVCAGAGVVWLSESGSGAGAVVTTADAVAGIAWMSAVVLPTQGRSLPLPLVVAVGSSFAAGALWLVANQVEAAQFVWRPFAVLAVVVAGFVHWTSLSLVVVLAGQALAPRTSLDPYLTVGVCAGLLLVLAVRPARPTSAVGALAAGTSDVALAAVALTLGVPAVGVLSGQPPSAAPLFAVVASLLLIVAGALLQIGLGARIRHLDRVEDRIIELGVLPAPAVAAVLDRMRVPGPWEPAKGRARLGGVDTAVALLHRNRALRAEIEGTVREVRASQVRLVNAADVERARMQARLAERVTPLLNQVDARLTELREREGGVGRDASGCLTETVALRGDLDELAAGLHPSALAAEGLAGALAVLAARCGLDASVNVPPGRFAEATERAVWFVCAECVANVVKHSGARSVDISIAVRQPDGALTVAVSDDGVGGAQLRPDGGLSGLEDRLRMLGGGLRIASSEKGSRVEGWLPCEV